ncbi:MAG TPA: SusC/RagA family TonB-linked outer membrane protein [Gemmatimonadaceae bacterium]|nr:SusC/RagA family TonB-linked outer membrane protein [Gemmatimonadaceae bacterium]
MTRISCLLFTLLLVVAFAGDASAQRRITGRVTDQESSEPLVGVNVSIAGTPYGVSTNDQGVFALPNAPAGDIVLNVRRIGYRRLTFPVPAGQSEVAIALVRDVLQLETQVVTGAATTVSSRNAANDVARVSADELVNAPAPSLENALAGRVAGAQIIANSGAPGGGNQVRLRGVTSVFGSADPLYVVDGVIISNDVVQPGINAVSYAARTAGNASNQDNGVNRIADINPNDIESIDILKGASASAIYGSKASNGVIIIKTKSGNAGRASVNVTQRFGTFDLANSYALRRYTLDEAIASAPSRFTEQDVRAMYERCGGFCDVQQQLFGEHQLSYETSISARGGTEHTTFFASALNKYDGGIEQNTGYRKQGVRLNLTQLFGNRLTLQLNNNLVRTMTRRGISNNDNANITPYFVMAGNPSWFDMRAQDGVYPVPIFGANLFQDRDFIRTPDEVYRIISSASLSYTPITGAQHTLQLRMDGGVDRYNEQVNVVSPPFLYFEKDDGLPGTNTSLTANALNANVNFSAIHTWTPASRAFTATTSAGVQREISDRRSENTLTRNVVVGQENVSRGSAVSVFADQQKIRGLALFAQEEFLTLGERLLATAGVRAERSTVNGDVNKFYAFPKGSVSYRLESPFSYVDELKLRVAAGQSGNQPLYIQKYSPAGFVTYQGQNAVQAGLVLGDPNIKPERQTEYEGGFDMSAFGRRASLNFTLYQKSIDDLILHISTAPSTSYDVKVRNGGSIRNRGMEIALAATPVERGGVTWISRTTFARNYSRVMSLPEGIAFFNVTRDASGQRVAFGEGYGLGRLEVGASATQIVASDTATVNGELVNIVRRYGDSAPVFTMGFANELTWRGWRLSTLFDWQHGGSLVNITQDVLDAFGAAGDPGAVDAQGKPDGGVARATKNDQLGIAQYVYDASFVKLREVTLSYELPATVSSMLSFGTAKSMRLEFSGRNLKTWTDYPGLDPEVSNFGSQQISRFIDLAPFPPSRSFFFTLDLGF